jgi:hypothetical protein
MHTCPNKTYGAGTGTLTVKLKLELELNSVTFSPQVNYTDRLCGLVVRVPGYRSRGPGSDSRRYQIF